MLVVKSQVGRVADAYGCMYSGGMTTTRTNVREILIKSDKNGRLRASYLSRAAFRMMPMPIADAELMISTGQAVRATVHPFTGEAI